ncbi:MAG: universal stress protein, partial [Solirubrobacterales bacterium]
EEPEYRSVLVAFEDDPFDEEMVATAKALAANRRRAIHVLSLITVPTHLPIDAELEFEESAAQAKIEQAKLICGQRVTGTLVRVRPGQGATAIVKSARELGAAAIVMQLRYRSGVPVYSKTLQAVMAKRPCRVLVTASPEAERAGVVTPSTL